MDKKCASCGAMVPKSAKFCQNCGETSFVQNEPSFGGFTPGRQSDFSQEQFSQPRPDQATRIPSGFEDPEKKSNVGLVIGIIAAVLVVLGIAIAIGVSFLGEDEEDYDYYGKDIDLKEDVLNEEDEDDGEYKEEYKEEYVAPPEPISYTKGTFDGSVYVNEWADLKLALPSGFSDGDASLYASAENDVTDCGAYFVADDTTSIIYICYEKLPTYPTYTEEKYMDAVMNSLNTITDIKYTTPSTYSKTSLCGYSYTKAVCQFENGYGTFTNTIYVRKIDNYIVFISIAGVSPEANENLAAQITRAR